MKHIKRFNESIKDDIEELCNNYLSYLIDMGFTIEIYRSPIWITNMTIVKKNGSNIDRFNWIDIKDDFLPFLEILKNEYVLDNYMQFSGYEPMTNLGDYTKSIGIYQEVENLPNNVSCRYISLKIKNKK